jgi:putative DNA methylase
MGDYPKRLIEVDLPIKRISAHARREKASGQNHISTLHIWWARRPLAACRAVICAALWPDPADDRCPESFRTTARNQMTVWAQDHLNLASEDSFQRFLKIDKNPNRLDDSVELRFALLDFIADFADWDNSTSQEYLETSGVLTQAAHEALGGSPGTRPLVVDPFAGGGSIPLEALRVGANAFASDLNPIPVLLNKVVLEFIPKYGKRVAEEVKKWGAWVKEEAEKELGQFYPRDPDGATPIAYLWARTIQCEGPGCGATIPLLTTLWLAKTDRKSVAFFMKPNHDKKTVDLEIKKNPAAKDVGEGTVRRGSVTCPLCGYTTPASNVRGQFSNRKGGADDALLVAVVVNRPGVKGRVYRLPSVSDLEPPRAALETLKHLLAGSRALIPDIPDEELPYLRSIFNVKLIGINEWGHLFSGRQKLSFIQFLKAITSAHDSMTGKYRDQDFAKAIVTILAIGLDKLIDSNSSICRWRPTSEDIGNTFGRQALGIVWDFAEINVFSGSSRDWEHSIDGCLNAVRVAGCSSSAGTAVQASASSHPFPDDVSQLVFTDPPYYDSVPYADLSDFFYVWLKRSIGRFYPELFGERLSPKQAEIVQLSERNQIYSYKTKENYENLMMSAMAEAKRILCHEGIGVVVFAHKQTDAWESQLQAMVNAGWVITSSWPIDTEKVSRLRAMNSAALASSIHLVCRPRQDHNTIGDWRDVLQELPTRIHDWMPRLAEEGVVGADAIFACLGPALEVFSRFSRVEKMSGDAVTLKEYLSEVWAAVAKEALTMIFSGADVTGFEEDARLTAMWLWTLKTGDGNSNGKHDDETAGEDDDVSKAEGKKGKGLTGFSLEYDAARKIAQGLGAHLENLSHLVAVQGETAVLLPVAARSRYLFGKDAPETTKTASRKKSMQLAFDFVGELGKIEKESTSGLAADPLKGKAGSTTLDQLHQSMLLFAAGRTEAVKRLLVEDGIGRNPLFWRLAQAMSALYPTATDEKRWVDGVLARKKSMGF